MTSSGPSLSEQTHLIPASSAVATSTIDTSQGANEPKTSFREASVILAKGFIGVGWMSIAFGFRQAQMAGSVFSGLLVVILTAIGMNWLIEIYLDFLGTGLELNMQDEDNLPTVTEQENEKKTFKASDLTYMKLAHLTLGSWGKLGVEVCLAVGQFGCLVAYALYMAETAHELIPSIPTWGFTLMVTPCMILLCQIREIKLLRDYSMIGVFAVIFAMMCIMGSCVHTMSAKGSAATAKPGFDVANFPEFFGIMFFSMEGIQVLLPVAHSMEAPQQAGTLTNLVVVAAGIMYMIVGFLGYLAYGQDVKAPITLNMDKSTFMDAVRVVQAVSIMMTVPVQAYPVSELLDKRIPGYPTAVRVGVVLLPVCIALALPHMAEALGIVGGLAMTALGIILPGFMYLRHFDGRVSPSGYWFIVSCVVFVAVFGLWASVISAIKLTEKI